MKKIATIRAVGEKNANPLGCSGKLNRIRTERKPNKISVLKDCLNKADQKQTAMDVCYYKISERFRLFYSQHIKCRGSS